MYQKFKNYNLKASKKRKKPKKYYQKLKIIFLIREMILQILIARVWQLVKLYRIVMKELSSLRDYHKFKNLTKKIITEHSQSPLSI